ncbi:MAG: hypothetical protein HYW00_00465, partial [Candidatus Colwellbacteria bacterium]|nr:hypothetical protein [Candidatus Colwellbacteria bacterium]
SFAVIVYLMAIAVPRVKDDELVSSGKPIGSLPLERIDAFLNSWKEKTLRRLRIYLLKAERSVTDQLHKSREVYERGREKRSFPKLKRRASKRQASDPGRSPNQENSEQ